MTRDQEILEHKLKQIADVIADFLLEEGGMENGYDTCISGDLRQGDMSMHLGHRELNPIEEATLVDRLLKRIRNTVGLPKVSLPVMVASRLDGHCQTTKVTVGASVRVDLYASAKRMDQQVRARNVDIEALERLLKDEDVYQNPHARDAVGAALRSVREVMTTKIKAVATARAEQPTEEKQDDS